MSTIGKPVQIMNKSVGVCRGIDKQIIIMLLA